ncbi:MAG: hypothetical protein ACE5IJ_00670 [Thermoplasmata archaeon]
MTVVRKWFAATARFVGVDSVRSGLWLAAAASVLVGLFLFQYSIYGTERYLGWDTSSYVARARVVHLLGPVFLANWYDFPLLYDLFVWIVGTGLGDLGLAERVLPLLVGMALVALYHRFGRELFRNPNYAGLTAVLAALSVNTLRLLSDLHRNLLSLTVAFAFLLVLHELIQGRRNRKQGFVLLLLFSAIGAYSQLETWAVLLVAVLIIGAFYRRIRWLAYAAMVLPFLLLAPLLLGYVANWAAFSGLRLAGEVGSLKVFTTETVLSFHGGNLFLLAVAVIGAVFLAHRGLRERGLWALLLMWCGVALGLLLTTPLGVPPHRLLYILPIPILLVIPPEALHRGLPTLHLRFPASFTRHFSARQRSAFRRVLPVLAAGLVVSASIVGLAAHKDRYLQPFVSEERIRELIAVADVLEGYEADIPIVPLWGSNGVWMHGVELGYVSSLSGPVLTYYGRPQLLLTMTDPLLAYPALTDTPDPTRTTARGSFWTLQRILGENAQIDERPILVETAGLYTRPVSDYFVLKHHVGPGVYLVPPGSVSPTEKDIWVFFGAYDWGVSAPFYTIAEDWAIAPQVLEYVVPSLAALWEASFPFVLTQDAGEATLSLHLPGTPAIPGTWQIPWPSVRGFEIYVDDRFIAEYEYGGQGPIWVNYTLENLPAGFHFLTMRAETVGEPFAITLDLLALYPRGVELDTILAAYAS